MRKAKSQAPLVTPEALKPPVILPEALKPRVIPRKEPMENPVWVRARTLARLLDCHLSHIWKMHADKELPEPTRIGKRTTLWNWPEVQEFLGLVKKDA